MCIPRESVEWWEPKQTRWHSLISFSGVLWIWHLHGPKIIQWPFWVDEPQVDHFISAAKKKVTEYANSRPSLRFHQANCTCFWLAIFDLQTCFLVHFLIRSCVKYIKWFNHIENILHKYDRYTLFSLFEMRVGIPRWKMAFRLLCNAPLQWTQCVPSELSFVVLQGSVRERCRRRPELSLDQIWSSHFWTEEGRSSRGDARQSCVSRAYPQGAHHWGGQHNGNKWFCFNNLYTEF